MADTLIGGILIHNDGTGDAYKFTHALSEACKKLGAKFHFNTTVQGLLTEGDKIIGIDTDCGIIKGDAYVIALGAHTSHHLANIGIKNDIFPNKGYSLSFSNPNPTNLFSFADPVDKIYICTLGDKIRVAGLSENIGFDERIYPEQIQKLLAKFKEILPNFKAADYSIWSCFRSSTKDSTPKIARTAKFLNLYINSGHGGFGWTLAPISARRICEFMG